MRTFTRTAITLSLTLIATGTAAQAQGADRQRRDRNVITAEEIRARPASNVRDLIKSHRANWLSTRGSATLRTREAADPWTGKAIAVPLEPSIVVYVDDSRMGSQDALRLISTEGVESIERLDAMTATQRYGTGHDHGAIVIRMRTR